MLAPHEHHRPSAPMTVFAALLRAVNVGGTGALPMADLRALCEAARFKRVRTYIQSGNVVLDSAHPEAKVKAMLEKALAAKMGQPVGVMVRTGAELDAILADNPFPGSEPAKTLVVFLDEAPAANLLDGLVAAGGEEVRLGRREIYVRYPDGQGSSKLKVPGAKTGTARNLNTVAKLAAMTKE